jgi:predicted nucleic acid-binding protein
MIFADLPSGTEVFLDANTLIYHFSFHSQFGNACTELVERIEHQDLVGYISAHVLNEVVHRLMTMEASSVFGRPFRGIVRRMKRHPVDVQSLSHYRHAIDEIPLLGIQILPLLPRQVSLAADVTRQFGLLNSDALVVVIMRDQGLTHLASNDADFDRVPGITRYGPV